MKGVNKENCRDCGRVMRPGFSICDRDPCPFRGASDAAAKQQAATIAADTKRIAGAVKAAAKGITTDSIVSAAAEASVPAADPGAAEKTSDAGGGGVES